MRIAPIVGKNVIPAPVVAGGPYDGVVMLQRPTPGGGMGTGLDGLADRIHALGGTIEVGPGEGAGFRLRVQLGAPAPPAWRVATAP